MMEFTLQKTEINCVDQVFSQTVRREETQDAVVPDTLPDMAEILCASGDILIRSKDVGEGRVRVEANIPAKIIYRPEGDGIACLEVNVPFYVSLEDENIPEDALCVADIRLVVLEPRMLNPRKVSVQAEAIFDVSCFVPTCLTFDGALEGREEWINVLEKPVALTPVCCVTEKTFVLTDTITFPSDQPPAVDVLSHSSLLLVEDVKTVGNKLVVKGSAKSTVLCAAGDGTPVPAEVSTAFSQIIEVSPMPEEPFVLLKLLPSGTYCDLSDGEGRTGNLELHIVAQAVVSSKAEAVVLADAYSNRYRLETATTPLETDAIRRELTLRETLREHFATPFPAAELIQGSVQPGLAQAESDGVTLPLTIIVFYQTTEGGMRTVRHSSALRFHCDLAPGQFLEPAALSVQELYLTPAEGGVEVRMPMEMTAFLRERETFDCISGIQCDETAAADHSDRPSLVLMRAGSTDDLWAIAKANCSTVRAIQEANIITDADGEWEKLILVPRTL